MIKKVLRFMSDITAIILIAVIVFCISQTIMNTKNPEQTTSIAGYKFMNVLTGSMQPAIQPGDMIVTGGKASEDIKVGEIITYKAGPDILVTHRVVEINSDKGALKFTTKGDANNTVDGMPVSYDKVIGVFMFRVPCGGYVTSFIKSWTGLCMLFVITLIVLTAGEIKNIISKATKKGKHCIKRKGILNIVVLKAAVLKNTMASCMSDIVQTGGYGW